MIDGPARGEDRLDLVANSDGEIDLSALTTVASAGQAQFIVDQGSFNLPNLSEIQNTNFDLQVGTEISLPQLTTWNAGSLDVPVGGTFELPNVDTFSGVNVTLGHDGTLTAPLLVNFLNSKLTLGSNQTINAPQFTNIDNSRFDLRDGAQFSVAATSYSATGRTGSDTLFFVSGAGTVLDLSSVQSINDSFNDGSGSELSLIHI